MMTGGPAETCCETRLRRRADFVRASKSGVRASCSLFSVQMAAREPESASAAPRFGFTVTKKVANAVGRNRIRRRLKEALRVGAARAPIDAPVSAPPIGPLGARAGRDYVFVARRAALDAAFADIIAQMTEGLAKLDRGAARSRNHNNRPSAS